ncbi:Hypothetical protein NGAL_HAMBI2427_42310 [Neorhizobium galegae bv. orientalis]|uniref:Uncharacterized protein n=1 Tax=Neorhizobium galegae bv. orientalis str. HAMBI 540 TaxID=1028800 RepID=A0A068T0K8_NEOGA|nr:Hypothetical protein RG540_PA12370 [Neorhizobium galegae bv. orientalis str. HAMBI 540]CDZ51599.1 Hypothetical protein NGAL_HAMBI2427_42310 [Neorhizobium galegae bv. orientalis]
MRCGNGMPGERSLLNIDEIYIASAIPSGEISDGMLYSEGVLIAAELGGNREPTRAVLNGSMCDVCCSRLFVDAARQTKTMIIGWSIFRIG